MFVKLQNSHLKFQIDRKDWDSTFFYKSRNGHVAEIVPSELKWYVNSNGYVYARKHANGYRCTPILHRLIKGQPANVIDHLSQDKLDNRSKNLRIVNHSRNVYNRKKPKSSVLSKYKGAYQLKDKYRAYIRHNYKLKYLGSFNTPEEAGRAYDKALKQFYPDAPKSAYNF